MTIFLILTFALANLARGRKLFDLTTSTSVGRFASTCLMAIITAYASTDAPILMAEIFTSQWITLMFWCVFAWDDLWSAEIGNDPLHSKLWGLFHMGLRMTLAAPSLFCLALITGHTAWVALLTPTLALPYLFWGVVCHRFQKLERFTIAFSEVTVGAMLGYFISLTINS